MGIENPKMQSLFWCNKCTGRYGLQITRFHAPCLQPRMEIRETSKLSKTMVLPFAPKQCLHQKVAMGIEKPKMQLLSRGNKRSGCYDPANNPVSCSAYRAENGNLENFEAAKNNGTAFARKQILYQNVALGMEKPKMQSLSRCNKRSGRYGPANNLVSYTAFSAENANLGKFEAVENKGTSFAPKQCLDQKIAVGMENPNMQSPGRCNKMQWELRPGKYTRFLGPCIGPRMEI